MLYLFFETLFMQLVVAALFCAFGFWIGRRIPGLATQASVPASAEIADPGRSRDEGAGKDAREESGDLAVALEKAESKLTQLRQLNEQLQSELESRDNDGESSVEQEEQEEQEEEEEEEEGTSSEESGVTGELVELDDLVVVRGIDQAMAEKLEAMGVRSYRQIAAWTKKDIEALPFKNRVFRNKWPKQAERLYKEKYGEKE